MTKIELVKPSVEMETKMQRFVFEFKKNKEEIINGCCGLTRYCDYWEWLQYMD